MEISVSWIFNEEIEVPEDIKELFVEGEIGNKAFKTVRDVAVFTNKRLIVKDKQGITGKKIEIYSLPYSTVNMWSTENAGTFDITSEVELWTKAGNIKIQLNKGIDIRQFEKLLAEYIL